MKRPFLRKTLVVLVLFLGIPAFLASEVFFLKNGEVLIGSLENTAAGQVSINSFGETHSIQADSIIKTVPGINEVKDIPLRIYLKDGTTIQGKLVDFDEDLGVFLDIGFGSLSIPISSIERIAEPDRQEAFQGPAFLIGAQGGVDFPLSESYGISGSAAALVEARITPVRGLYAGGTLSYGILDYTESEDLRYWTLALQAHASYRFLGLGLGSSETGTNMFIPYAKLGGGINIVNLNDDRAEAPVGQRGLLTGCATAELGIDLNFFKPFYIRVFGSCGFIFQTDGPFIIPGAGIGIVMPL